MDPHSKYIKAERALDAISTLSCSIKTLVSRGDESLCRAASSKSILRLERYLNPTLIVPRRNKVFNQFFLHFPNDSLFVGSSFAAEGE